MEDVVLIIVANNGTELCQSPVPCLKREDFIFVLIIVHGHGVVLHKNGQCLQGWRSTLQYFCHQILQRCKISKMMLRSEPLLYLSFISASSSRRYSCRPTVEVSGEQTAASTKQPPSKPYPWKALMDLAATLSTTLFEPLPCHTDKCQYSRP